MGVNVLTMKDGQALHGQTVVAEDGRIKVIGPAGQVPTDGMRVLDGRGRWVMPGLADMHAHTWDPGEWVLYVANGVTTVRNMWGNASHLALEERKRRGELPGPRIVTASPLIDGLSPQGKTLWQFSGYLEDDPAKAWQLVKRFAEQGYGQIKAYSQLNREQLAALGEASREYGVRLVGHCPDPLTFEEAVDLGMSCFEHLTNVFHGHFKDGRGVEGRPHGLDPEIIKSVLRAVVEKADMQALHKLAELLAAKDVWNCITATVWQGPIGGEDAFEDNRMRYVAPGTKSWWQFRVPTDEEIRDLGRRSNERRLEVLSLLREAQAPVLIGTDTPNPFVVQGFSLHDELDNFVRAGFSNQQVLEIATAVAARFCGQEDEWGTLAEGMRADLVVVESDPRDDLSALRRPWAVASNGYFFDRSDLDSLLAGRIEQIERPAVIEERHVDHAKGYRHLVQRQNGSVFGKICCTAIPHPQGTMLEEDSCSPMGKSRRTILLGAHKELVRLEGREESEAGERTVTIEREEGGYRSEVRDFDGFVLTSSIESEPLPPSEYMGFTALAEVVGSFPEGGDVPTLSLEGDELKIVPAKPIRSEDGIEVQWLRKGWPTTQTFHLDDAGRVVGMHDQLGGARELSEEEVTEA